METTSSSWLEKIHSHPAVRFAVVGAISTVWDVLVYTLLLKAGVNIYLATALGFLVGLTNGYLMNSRFVFAQERSAARYGKYAVVSGIGLLLTELIIHLLHVDWAHLSALKAKLVAVVLVFFWNYGMSKLWAFK